MAHSELPRQPCPPSPEAVPAPSCLNPPSNRLCRVGTGVADTSVATLVAGSSCGAAARSHNLALIASTRAAARIVTPLVSGVLFSRSCGWRSGPHAAQARVITPQTRTVASPHDLSPLITTSHTDSSSRICVLANPIYARAHLPCRAVTARFPHLPPPPRCRGLPPSPRLCVYDLLQDPCDSALPAPDLARTWHILLPNLGADFQQTEILTVRPPAPSDCAQVGAWRAALPRQRRACPLPCPSASLAQAQRAGEPPCRGRQLAIVSDGASDGARLVGAQSADSVRGVVYGG